MKYIEFRKLVKTPIFTSQDLKNLGATHTPSQLTGWLKLGYLTKLRGGLYGFSDTLPSLPTQVIASNLYSPSYLSLSFALSHFGIIPEAVHTFTSITAKTTRTYKMEQGTFTYQHLPPHLFFGYTQIKVGNMSYNLAEKEKALLDYFYLTPSIKNSKDLYELRLNTNSLQSTKLHDYLSQFDSRRLDYLVRIMEKMYAHN